MDPSVIFTDYPDLIPLLRCIDRYEWLCRSCSDPAAYDSYAFKLREYYSKLDVYYNDPRGALAVSEASKLVSAYRSRLKRLRHRIAYYLTLGSCLFVTLTFTDDVLNSTSFDSRKSYVRRWCKSVSKCYVANVDYGIKNEREHYHCVILVDSVSPESWPYGLINFKRIRGSSFKDWRSSCGKLSRYTAKLALHALKDSTKQSSIIYSRGAVPEEVFKTVEKDDYSRYFT